MKKLHYLFLLLVCFLAGATLNGCSSDEETLDNPNVATCSAEATDLRPGNVTVTLTTSNLKSYSYLLYTKEEAPAAAPTIQVVNATGKKGDLTDGANPIRLGAAIQPSTDYIAYFALTTNEDTFYDKVVSVPFTTTPVDEIVSLLQQKPDGIVVNINVPQSVTDAGHVLRWDIVNWFTHITRIKPDLDALIFNGQKMIDKSQALDICNANAFDETEVNEEGEPIQYYNLMVPGEPLVLILGEFQWTDEPEWGWTPGYHDPLFNLVEYYTDYPGDTGLTPPLGKIDLNYTKEDPYWTGYHSRHLFYTAQPEKMDKTVKWESIDPKPNHYTIRFTPDEGISSFSFFILADEEYKLFTQYIGGEEHWQWFVTSAAAVWEGARSVVPANGQDYLKGVFEITSEEILQSGMEPTPNDTYHIIMTAMGNKTGMLQSHVNATFTLPDYTLPAPEVTVTPLEEKTTDREVFFNIKNTNPNVPVAWAGYVCGYQSDFAGSNDYASLVMGSNGARLTDESIAKINSEEGLEISFSSRANATTRLAVLVKNEEGLRNDINAKNSPAVADIRSKRPADAPRVESELFDKLTGEWTATASVSVLDSQAGTFVPVSEPRQVKVTVQGGIEYTDQAPSIIQENNPLWDPAEIAMYWEQYKEEAALFNSGVRGQNRLLCTGFGFEETEPFAGRLQLQTPLDLFARPDYSSTVANLFVNFGPKWYFQIAEGDKVTVPVNIDTIGSLCSWADGTDYYMMGWNFSDGQSSFLYYDPTAAADADLTLHFPVTVSDDCNTITIHPFEFDGKKYYPSTTYFSKTTAGAAETTKTIITSPIVMTRGWNGKSTSAAQYPAVRPTRTKACAGTLRLDRTPIEKAQPIQRLEASPYRDAACKRMQQRMGR